MLLKKSNKLTTLKAPTYNTSTLMAAGSKSPLALHNKKSPLKLKSMNSPYTNSNNKLTTTDKLKSSTTTTTTTTTSPSLKQPTTSSAAAKKSLALNQNPTAFNKLANNLEHTVTNSPSTSPFSINNVSNLNSNKQHQVATASNAAKTFNINAKSINILRPPSNTTCNTTTTILKTTSLNSCIASINNCNLNDLSSSNPQIKKVNFIIPENQIPENSSSSTDDNVEKHAKIIQQHAEKHFTGQQYFKKCKEPDQLQNDKLKNNSQILKEELNDKPKLNSKILGNCYEQHVDNNVYKQNDNYSHKRQLLNDKIKPQSLNKEKNDKTNQQQHVLPGPNSDVYKHVDICSNTVLPHKDTKNIQPETFKKEFNEKPNHTSNLVVKHHQQHVSKSLGNNVYNQQHSRHTFLKKHIVYNGTFPIDMPLTASYNNYDPEANFNREDFSNYQAYESDSNEDDDEDDENEYDDYQEDEDEVQQYENNYLLNQDLESLQHHKSLAAYGILKAKTKGKPSLPQTQKPPQVWSMQELINDPSIPLNYKKMCNEVEQSLQEFEQYIDSKSNSDDKAFKMAKPPVLRTFNIDDPIDLKKNI